MIDFERAFEATEQRLAVTCGRYPAFAREPAVLVRLVKLVHKRIQDSSNGLLRPLGINDAQYNLLMMLYGTEGYAMNPSQLAEASGEKPANLTRLTDELCDRQLVKRTADPGDRRKLTLTLTEQGMATIESLLPDIGAFLEQQVEELQPRERLQLEKLLKKLLGGPAPAARRGSARQRAGATRASADEAASAR